MACQSAHCLQTKPIRIVSLCSSDRFNITLDDGLLLRGISDTRAVSVYPVRHFVHITHSLVFLRTYYCQPSFMGTSQIAWVTVHIGPTAAAGVILDVASVIYNRARPTPRPAFQLLPTPHTRLRIVEESLSGTKQ